MQEKIIARLISILISNILTKKLVLQLTTEILVFVEKFVLGTASEIDDEIVLPLIDALKAVTNEK